MASFNKISFLSLVCLLLFMVPVALFASGAREIALGDVFPAACADCHGPDPEYAVLGAAAYYDYSGHKNHGNASYANGAGCQVCHTNEGFIQKVKGVKIESSDYIANPSAIGCFTCHDPHTTGDFALRTNAPGKLASGESYNFGDGNLCANCHQARRDAMDAVAANPADAAVASHYGAHHGPQADILAGANAYEYPGKSYTSTMHSVVIKDGCVQCHMALPEARYSMNPEIGGHSFSIAGEVHEAEKANTSGCIACHADIKQVAGQEIFNITAKADYDNDGKAEPVQTEVKGLLEYFVNGSGSGLLQQLSPPMYKADGSWNTVKAPRTQDQMAALYNHKMILEDRSLGVHNTKYIVQLLYDSIEALNPRIDTSSRRP